MTENHINHVCAFDTRRFHLLPPLELKTGSKHHSARCRIVSYIYTLCPAISTASSDLRVHTDVVGKSVEVLKGNKEPSR